MKNLIYWAMFSLLLGSTIATLLCFACSGDLPWLALVISGAYSIHLHLNQ